MLLAWPLQPDRLALTEAVPGGEWGRVRGPMPGAVPAAVLGAVPAAEAKESIDSLPPAAPRPTPDPTPALRHPAVADAGVNDAAGAATGATVEPFSRLEILPPAAVARLRTHAERSVASWRNAFAQIEPSTRESYVGLDLELHVARSQAVLDQAERGLAYDDDLTFGTEEERWFNAHGAELVRVHSHGVRALFVLDHAQYPDVPRLRQRFEAAARGAGLPAALLRPDRQKPQKG